ncbi:MAG: hypothetical protein LBU65_02655 [Planctomycetaceae bacterium]|nr:hypothetical protein [Planctomycetaceae bacterium]
MPPSDTPATSPKVVPASSKPYQQKPSQPKPIPQKPVGEPIPPTPFDKAFPPSSDRKNLDELFSDRYLLILYPHKKKRNFIFTLDKLI